MSRFNSPFARTATAEAVAPKARVRKSRAKAVEVEVEQPDPHLPGTAQVFTATILGAGVYAASFYTSMTLVNVVTTALMTLTGVGFVSFVLWFVGVVLSVLGALRLGFFVAKTVLDYEPGQFADAGATVRAAAQRKVSMVRGWFTRSDDEIGSFAHKMHTNVNPNGFEA